MKFFLTYKSIFYIIISCLIYSCSGTKHLQENEYLLRKNTIKIKGINNLSQKSIIKDEINTIIKQHPNSYILGMPYRVNFYNLRRNTYIHNPNHYQLRSKFVEAPVILDSNLTTESINNIIGYLSNVGFFNPTVNSVIKYKNKKAFVNYDIVPGHQFHINNVNIACSDSNITRILLTNKNKTHLQPATYYSHFIVAEERIRIVNILKNWGYYNLGTSNISFELDTVVDGTKIKNNTLNPINNKSKPIDILINITPNKNRSDFNVYHFENINVYLQHEERLQQTAYQHSIINNINYYHLDNKYLNYNIIDQKITLRKGQVYTQDAYNQTLKLLNELDILQLIRVNISQSDNDTLGLNVDIILSPNKKYDFSTNVEISGGELYTLGSALKLNFINKNLLKGANRLSITGSYGIETNLDKSNPESNFIEQFYLFSQNLGLNFNLTFPKFIHPFKNYGFSRTMVPKTYLEGGVNQLDRTDYFGLRSINAGWGYRWRASNYEQWGLKPIFVNLLNLYKVSDMFQHRMDSIPAIRNSYQETLIEGESFEYLYNSELKNPNKYTIIKLGIEESGLVMNGVNALHQSFNKNSTALKYAEYVRLDFDLRKYVNKRKSTYALRFYGGVGIPYNKASSLPYIKQYFVGGAYSIRGWRPRVLGPGSYDALSNNNDNYLFVDQAGDVKLELNSEYRFPIITLWGGSININGALFIDAGNIWMMKPVQNMPGAEFKFNKLYQDIAASYGIGLRFDLGGFLVIRSDFAFQAKKPYIKEHDGWTIQNTQYTNREWRRENMNFNIAIGYPF